MKHVYTLIVLALCCGLTMPSGAAESAAGEAGWESIFNGKNLDGWTPKIRYHELGENWNDTFRVEDGVMKVSYDQYGGVFKETFGHIFYKTPYSHYKFRMEYRFTGDQIDDGPGWAFRNSGIMLHGQDPATMDKDQDFPVSIEVQLLGGDGEKKRSTANLCTPGTNVVLNDKLFKPHCIVSRSKTYHGDQWVKVEVEVQGNEFIQHFVNGEAVFEYEKPQLDPRDESAKKVIKDGELMLSGGTISLQSESHPVEFRNIEILDLSKK
jgi:hypothetical protein